MTATASLPKPKKLSLVAAVAETGEVATISLSDLVEALRQQPVAPTEPPHRPLLVRQVDAPSYVGVSRATMFRLIAAGDWPDAADVPGSGTMYRRKDLDEWVAKRKPARR